MKIKFLTVITSLLAAAFMITSCLDDNEVETEYSSVLMDDAVTLAKKCILIGTIGLIYFITYLILRASTRLNRYMGETGNNVMMRLMGLILMVIAVECFVSGFKPIMIDILQHSNL